MTKTSKVAALLGLIFSPRLSVLSYSCLHRLGLQQPWRRFHISHHVKTEVISNTCWTFRLQLLIDNAIFGKGLKDKRCAFFGDASSYFLFHVTVVSWNFLSRQFVIQRGNLDKSVNEGRWRMFRREAELCMRWSKCKGGWLYRVVILWRTVFV
jgi:hypothetical protein